MNRKEIVLTALNRLLKESLHKDQSKRPKTSICNYTITASTTVSCVLHSEDEKWVCAGSWKHYSGDVVYPVPCPDGGSATGAYCNAENNGNAFWVGKYGNSRRAYLRHMIQWVQDNLDESE